MLSTRDTPDRRFRTVRPVGLSALMASDPARATLHPFYAPAGFQPMAGATWAAIVPRIRALYSTPSWFGTVNST